MPPWSAPPAGWWGERLDDAGLEAALIARAQNGDMDACEALLRRYEDVAFRVAYLILRDAAEAEDAAQEAFVRAHAALGRFRRGEPFRPWLLRIVANQALSSRRAAGRRAALAERYGQAASRDGEPLPEAVALQHEQRGTVKSRLHRALGRLRPWLAGRFPELAVAGAEGEGRG